MTSPNSAVGPPLAAAAAADVVETDHKPDTGPTIGASDADAARSGADVDLTNADRDSDGTAVGDADRDAEAERSRAGVHGRAL